ncbi:hypothetical protein [Myxococcus sp. RHSTA-1-4]|uniref:hypothetical protein n=1 Tax=Myxococcus sp. RHSTA-1-4 TaxID=2874601 RepID=UPI001CBEE1A3|nr:hypothetical protein [Myxococcus sp. RHSTA-1-4]MBZ4416704.1 hypothetical protein [Myxococcus sp. RHSTA-1-4]
MLACGSVAGESELLAAEPQTNPEAPEQEVSSQHRKKPLPEPRPLRSGNVAVAYGGGKYLVAWEDVREGNVYATRVKPDGTLLDPEGIRLNPLPGAGGQPAIAYDGTNFVVVWDTGDGASGIRVSPRGEVIGELFEVFYSGDVFGPVDIACGREMCLVTYEVTADDADDIWMTRMRPDGTVLETRSLSDSDRDADSAAVAWNGREFLVVWGDTRGGDLDARNIHGARVLPDGTILDPGGRPLVSVPGDQRTPDVVWTGRRFLVVWSDNRGGDYDVYGARVRSDGRVEDPDGLPISTAAGDQLFPSVAHHGPKSLVVWGDSRDGAPRVWGARVTEYGEVKDPSGFLISSGDFAEESTPEVAYGADRFLAVYEGTGSEGGYTLAARVKHDTRVLDSPARVLTRSTEEPEVESTR